MCLYKWPPTATKSHPRRTKSFDTYLIQTSDLVCKASIPMWVRGLVDMWRWRAYGHNMYNIQTNTVPTACLMEDVQVASSLYTVNNTHTIETVGYNDLQQMVF